MMKYSLELAAAEPAFSGGSVVRASKVTDVGP